MQTGTKGKTTVSPRNRTGQIYAANVRRAEAEKHGITRESVYRYVKAS